MTMAEKNPFSDLFDMLIDSAFEDPKVREAARTLLGMNEIERIERSWWTVLGFEAKPTTIAIVEKRYRELVRQHHPDRPGGSQEKMAEINVAMEAARKDLG